MTKEEFFNFLIKQGCEAVPKEGVNNTHHFIEFRKKINMHIWHCP